MSAKKTTVTFNNIDESATGVEEENVQYNINVNNEHDKIFRKILDDKKEAIKFINKTLKYNLKEDEIEKYNSSFVTEELKNQESDIIYKLKDKNVFFLIEHQTKVDYTMPMRILEYEYHIIKSAINKENLGKKEYKFPRVISIVLYSGRKKWNVEDYIEKVQEKIDGYNMQVLAKYNLVDVNNFNVEELLKEESFISKAMLIEKMRYTEELGGYLEKIVKEINNKKDIYTKEQKELLGTVIKLVLNKKLDRKEIEELINELKEDDEDMLAVLEMIEEENKRLLRQGRKEGKREIARKMLAKNMPLSLIVEIVGLKEKEIEKLKNS